MEQQQCDIRINVATSYIDDQSEPDADRYVFAYTITISNDGDVPATLLSRHWIITDANGKIQEVSGDGVVGEQPHLEPGAEHQYRSFCVLRSPAGYMEGSYTFERPTGERFRVAVPRFTLSAPFMSLPEEGHDEVMN